MGGNGQTTKEEPHIMKSECEATQGEEVTQEEEMATQCTKPRPRISYYQSLKHGIIYKRVSKKVSFSVRILCKLAAKRTQKDLQEDLKLLKTALISTDACEFQDTLVHCRIIQPPKDSKKRRKTEQEKLVESMNREELLHADGAFKRSSAGHYSSFNEDKIFKKMFHAPHIRSTHRKSSSKRSVASKMTDASDPHGHTDDPPAPDRSPTVGRCEDEKSDVRLLGEDATDTQDTALYDPARGGECDINIGCEQSLLGKESTVPRNATCELSSCDGQLINDDLIQKESTVCRYDTGKKQKHDKDLIGVIPDFELELTSCNQYMGLIKDNPAQRILVLQDTCSSEFTSAVSVLEEILGFGAEEQELNNPTASSPIQDVHGADRLEYKDTTGAEEQELNNPSSPSSPIHDVHGADGLEYKDTTAPMKEMHGDSLISSLPMDYCGEVGTGRIFPVKKKRKSEKDKLIESLSAIEKIHADGAFKRNSAIVVSNNIEHGMSSERKPR